MCEHGFLRGARPADHSRLGQALVEEQLSQRIRNGGRAHAFRGKDSIFVDSAGDRVYHPFHARLEN